MSITRPAKKTVAVEQSPESFINAAPDSGTKVQEKTVKGVMRGNKQQISLTIQPELLVKIDALAGKLGQSRAAVINLAIYKAVETGLIN